MISALSLVLMAAFLLAICAATTASAPTAPTSSDHEGYPFTGTPPSGHEQGVVHNSFTSPTQQNLYAKYTGFYHDYAKT